MECPSKMYMTGIEVKRGRREIGDKDTYDFKLQCSGVWQSFMGMKFSGYQETANKECAAGEGASGVKVLRGFVEWGDKDLYEYDVNCKSIAQNLASIRGLPDLKILGLPRNVLVWDGEQLGAWLKPPNTPISPTPPTPPTPQARGSRPWGSEVSPRTSSSTT